VSISAGWQAILISRCGRKYSALPNGDTFFGGISRVFDAEDLVQLVEQFFRFG
jgi:hypothetical protein